MDYICGVAYSGNLSRWYVSSMSCVIDGGGGRGRVFGWGHQLGIGCMNLILWGIGMGGGWKYILVPIMELWSQVLWIVVVAWISKSGEPSKFIG